MSARPPGPRPLVIAVIPDLLFATRITETARAAGIELLHVSLADLAARVAERWPDRVVLDLTVPEAAPAIAALRATPGLGDLSIVGFYPHVDDALRRAALAAGATHVLPRSAFASKLAEVLTGAFPPAP